MPGFFKEMDTAYGRLDFHFIGIHSPEGRVVFVSVRGPFQKAHVLELQQQGSDWLLTTPGVPQWLQEIEGELVAVVEGQGEKS